jgi:competence protein ComEC
MRQSLARIIDNSLSLENASFHKAIILGFQKGITQKMRDAFNATGLAHLLSISGTHFALLAFIFFTLVRTTAKFLPIKILTKMTLYATPSQTAVVLTMPVLILYALISGGSTPTVRSLIMIFIYMLALFLGRKGQWLNSLAIAAVVILIWQPDALFDLSFQLSFIAVLSTGYALEIAGRGNKEDNTRESGPGLLRLNFVRKIAGKIKISLFITIAAIMGTAPVALHYFYQFPVISPVTNLLITPFVCFVVLPAGFFAGFFALLFNMNSLPAGYLIDFLTDLPLNLTKTLSHIPFSSLHLHKPPVITIALYFLSLAFFVKAKSKWKLLPLVLVFCFYMTYSFLPADKNFRITFLDVGQGDASFIEFPDERVMLVDGGAEDYDAGRRVIAPYLWAKGIKKIDYMVLSHPHPDHYGGLIYLMDNFKVGEA